MVDGHTLMNEAFPLPCTCHMWVNSSMTTRLTLLPPKPDEHWLIQVVGITESGSYLFPPLPTRTSLDNHLLLYTSLWLEKIYDF